MNSDMRASQPYGFALGLLTGTVIGAGLAMWLAPRAVAELRERVIDSAKNLGKRVGEHREQVTTYVEETAEELSRRGQVVRDNIAEAVAHHAHEVEAYATASRTDRGTGARKRSANDRPAPASRMP
jgi:gas vesicle protein